MIKKYSKTIFMMLSALMIVAVSLKANHSENVGTTTDQIIYELGDESKVISIDVPKFAHLGEIDGLGNTGNRFIDAVRNFFRGNERIRHAALGGPTEDPINAQEGLSIFDA